MQVRINYEQVAARVMGAFEKGLPVLSEQILNDCNQYCKEDSGQLIASSQTASDLPHGILRWQTPYARRQYWEIRTANPFPNPLASWRWCEVAKANHSKRWQRQAQRLVDMNL